MYCRALRKKGCTKTNAPNIQIFLALQLFESEVRLGQNWDKNKTKFCTISFYNLSPLAQIIKKIIIYRSTSPNFDKGVFRFLDV